MPACSASPATTTGWCAFVLAAITRQAETNEAKARAILDLYRRDKEGITGTTRSQHAIRALDWLFSHPVFKTSDFIVGAGIPKPTANRILRVARKRGRLAELRASSGRRAAILGYPALLEIAEERQALLRLTD